MHRLPDADWRSVLLAIASVLALIAAIVGLGLAAVLLTT